MTDIRVSQLPTVSASALDATSALVLNDGGVTSTITAQNLATGLGTTLSVKTFGAVGDGTTDDTAAIQVALTAAIAAGGTVYFPPGIYLCGALTTIASSGIRIVGAGRYATIIKGTATTWLTLDTFSATPASPYGSYDTLTISDLTLDGQQTGTADNSRTRRCITDNGYGNLSLSRLRIIGWQYGLKANYGSDYDRVDDCLITYCDVGVYLAYGSDHGVWTGVEIANCVLGMVTDGVMNLTAIGCAFQDCLTAGFQAEYLAVTRSGVTTPTNTGTSHNEGVIFLIGCWFESVTRTPTNGHVHTFSDVDMSYPRGVHVASPFLVAGGPGSAVPFWKWETGRFMLLEDLVIQGTKCSYAVDHGASAAYMRQYRTRTQDGYTAVPWWNNQDSNCRGEGLGGAVTTFTSLDTSPSVAVGSDQSGASSHEVFKATNGSATSITTFDDGYSGQMITVICTNGNTTFVNGTPLKTRTGANVTASANTAYSFVYDGTTWWATS